MTTATSYDTQAVEFLRRHSLVLHINKATRQHCPPWADRPKGCDHMHGNKYAVRVVRHGDEPMALRFDFWGSAHDKANGRDPSAYDVLACLSADSSAPATPDEVVEEFGPMRPSQAIATAEHGAKVRQFFRAGLALTALREIQ